MSTRAVSIGIEDLTELAGPEVAARNGDLQHFARREFALGGPPFRFERVMGQEPGAQRGDVWLALQFAGSAVVIRVAREWAAGLADASGVVLADLNNEMLNLLCLTRLAPRLPPGVSFLSAAFSRDGLELAFDGLEARGTWRSKLAATGEQGGQGFQLWAGSGFPVYAFLAAFDGQVHRWLPPALATLNLSLPLVAARWSLDADQLVGLAPGDVLLIG